MRATLLTGLAVAGLCIATSSCTKDRTEVVIGIATDLSAPDALDQVKLEVYRDGVPIIDLPPWDIPGTAGGDYVLPASFGVYADDGSEPSIDVRVHGMKAGGVIVTRRALFSLVRGKTLFFRMGLVARCVSTSDCPGVDQTCVEGVCRSAEVDAHTFLAYIPGMEKTVACSSGTTFTDTGTGMPLGGADSGGGTGCAPDEVCQEGTCYKVPGGSSGGPDGGAADGGAGLDGGVPTRDGGFRDAGVPSTCSFETCGGCCSADGECLPGDTAEACGAAGNPCFSCPVDQPICVGDGCVG